MEISSNPSPQESPQVSFESPRGQNEDKIIENCIAQLEQNLSQLQKDYKIESQDILQILFVKNDTNIEKLENYLKNNKDQTEYQLIKFCSENDHVLKMNEQIKTTLNNYQDIPKNLIFKCSQCPQQSQNLIPHSVLKNFPFYNEYIKKRSKFRISQDLVECDRCLVFNQKNQIDCRHCFVFLPPKSCKNCKNQYHFDNIMPCSDFAKKKQLFDQYFGICPCSRNDQGIKALVHECYPNNHFCVFCNAYFDIEEQQKIGSHLDHEKESIFNKNIKIFDLANLIIRLKLLKEKSQQFSSSQLDQNFYELNLMLILVMLMCPIYKIEYINIEFQLFNEIFVDKIPRKEMKDQDYEVFQNRILSYMKEKMD